MYYYIIDPKDLNQKAFERVQNKLYSSLSEYRISGETVRSTGLRTIPQLVEIAFSHGARTIVAVGSDDTLNDIINAVKLRDITIAFIPLYETELGTMLGLKDIESASKTLATRRIANLDLGMVNNNFFLSKLAFGPSIEPDDVGFFNFSGVKKLNEPPIEVKFTGDGSFNVTLKVISGLILNCRLQDNNAKIANPVDSVLDVLLLPKLSRFKLFKYRKDIARGFFEKIPGSSLLHIRKMSINSPEGLALRVGNKVLAKTPATIEVLPRALKIIVGRDRTF